MSRTGRKRMPEEALPSQMKNPAGAGFSEITESSDDSLREP